MNVLPRALYGELNWQDALAAALDRGEIARLTAGRANGEAFYVAAVFGAPTLLARAREAMREGKILAAWRRLRHAFKRSFSRGLRARPDGEPMRTAEAIGVLCPAFSGGVRADDLEWVRLDARHLIDFARVSLRALTRGLARRSCYRDRALPHERHRVPRRHPGDARRRAAHLLLARAGELRSARATRHRLAVGIVSGAARPPH